MTYGQYPFWLKNQADNASADAMASRREVNNAKEQLEKQINDNIKNLEKINTIMIEITKYKSLGSTNITKKQLTEILNKIAEILLK